MTLLRNISLFPNEEVPAPEKGDLLISEPFLADPVFERTVILICDHSEDGTIGFVLNKPSALTFDEVVKKVASFKETLYVGGPVQPDTLHFIHRSQNLLDGAIKIGDGLYWGGNYEQLLSLIKDKNFDPNAFRFFLGYSGWGKDQLGDEIKRKSWIVYKSVKDSDIFGLPVKSLWREVLKKMGGKYRVISNYPTDPRLN